MKKINETNEKTFGRLPETILQMGEGNFLRAFIGTVVEHANKAGKLNGSTVIVPPIPGEVCEKLMAQDCMYTVTERGIENGETVERSSVITSVSRCVDPLTDWDELIKVACKDSLRAVISNTTEAGIVYCKGVSLDEPYKSVYPARLTALLYARYRHFCGDASKGLFIAPCELIEDNGTTLKRCVLQYACDWNIESGFSEWLNSACCFANTLVDRIVTGFPKDDYDRITEKLGYEDKAITTCETFFFWAIECENRYKSMIPVDGTGLDIVFAEDIKPYRTRKVRILNGAHTSSVLAAYLCGFDTVGEMMECELFKKYLERFIFDEVIPVTDMAEDELTKFASAVFERFANPFIKHRLLDISLNSVSKYKARCKGTLLDNIANNENYNGVLTFALAALICFYRGEFSDGKYFGSRNGEKYEIRDSESVCRFMSDAWKNGNPAEAVLSNTDFWGEDLSVRGNLLRDVEVYIGEIMSDGIRKAVEQFIL